MQTCRKYLIVNGDDFGASEEVNEAVIQAHQRGVLTSCSLMAAGAAFDGAVRLARANPALAVGIHVTCVNGKSVLPHPEIPHLVDWDSNFSSDPARAGLKYFFAKERKRNYSKKWGLSFKNFMRPA